MTEGIAQSVAAEAEQAANEAAREARAEVLERSAKTEPEKKPSRRITKASTSSDTWQKFVVDVWLTDLNPTEFGIYKHSRNRAKSRQFSSDMDIYAEVIENGERTGLLGYRKDLWKDAKGMDRRLVFKLFTPSLNWRATMDLMVGRSLQLTLGARGVPVMAYSINTHDDNFMIYLERSALKWPFLPEHFSFFIVSDGTPKFFRLERALINIGGDYTLYDEHNKAIGYIDGKILSIAGKWKGAIRSEHADKKLLTVMKLFSGLIIFNRQARWHMWRLWHDVIDGRISPALERQESDLYKNPRRVR
ncbi:conserved protein of unknown function [Candidatus Filomicrobium marinum]|uniref:Uncharacterized protein n=2 Tax=Filomicrobium TaxID=119044 RepID=A0A0D6JBZ6_9HYPH|nr:MULTISPECIES: hypothetical protein [Filomicrobium]MCV0370540.1 hypothetical protein [Filomicrobium sp.]CFX08059.1 conserved protein of unknown function [Candidatus Filomicrobium marinum]CPR16726.1 conserved protein of unknown function [Candidatus Filomicrobium marinum]SDP59420.1 hypothetical protein SAMN04488061_3449 [Filomicrobium insigne]